MQTVTAKKFNAPLLSWARSQFTQELQSDFRRIKQFDVFQAGLRVRDCFAALQKQTTEHLVVLSQVLPLGVFWEMPDSIKARNQLPLEERQAVERLRNDFKAEYDRNYNHHLEILSREHDSEIKKLFRLVVKEGNKLQKQVGKQRDMVVARADPGAWGFIGERSWGRATASVFLSRSMTLGYTISIKNGLGETIRFHDHYLKVLGIGAGEWQVESKDEFAEKFLKASEFAFWHIEEYEVILSSLLAD